MISKKTNNKLQNNEFVNSSECENSLTIHKISHPKKWVRNDIN